MSATHQDLAAIRARHRAEFGGSAMLLLTGPKGEDAATWLADEVLAGHDELRKQIGELQAVAARGGTARELGEQMQVMYEVLIYQLGHLALAGIHAAQRDVLARYQADQ
ncbi:MAG TPA: hypothetical protein VFB37_07175 [Steroidobacteraceae bacterium]|nr:hypothetical protein [Steroidobacteraceae bacterium]